MEHMHFWTLEPCQEVDDWDPDREPLRYLNGFGHGFLELYTRLKHSGYSVTLGPDIPRRSAVIVVSLEELSGWMRHGRPATGLTLAKSLLGRRVALAVIRTDLHLHIRSPLCTTLEIMPTQSSITDVRRQVCLPLLPQRGVLARDATREPSIKTVGLKAYSQNIPEWLPELRRLLSDQNVGLRVDTELDGGFGWHNFFDLDSVLCVQPNASLLDERRKPPTKLVNAWAGNVIPICSPLTGYVELARSDQGAIFASNPAEIASAIRSVNSDRARAADLFAASKAAGAAFSVDRLVPRWVQTLRSAEAVRASRVLQEIVICSAQIHFGLGVSRRLLGVVKRSREQFSIR